MYRIGNKEKILKFLITNQVWLYHSASLSFAHLYFLECQLGDIYNILISVLSVSPSPVMTILRKNPSIEPAPSLCSPPLQINSLWSDSRQVEARMKRNEDGGEDGAGDGENEWCLKMMEIAWGYTEWLWKSRRSKNQNHCWAGLCACTMLRLLWGKKKKKNLLLNSQF